MLFSDTMRYTINDLRQDFPDDESVLEWLVDWMYPEGVTCRICIKVTKHYKDKNRRSYSCGKCGLHFHPTAGSMLHKTRLPLIYWVYAIYRITTTRTGLPATHIQRELGVTYNTAWKMLHKIREQMGISDGQLKGKVEIDETFLHGNVYKRSSAQKKYGRTGARKGQIVWGAVERGGRARLVAVRYTGATELLAQVKTHIDQEATIYSDGYSAYRQLKKRGYKHHKTFHEHFQWTEGDNYTQNIESLWSRFKMAIKADYRFVSDRHLQKYCNEFAWRHSYRSAVSMFWSLLGILFPSPLYYTKFVI